LYYNQARKTSDTPMNVNPLFPSADGKPEDNGYVLPRQERRIEPLGHTAGKGVNEAVSLIRQKIERIYAEEPDARTEEREAEQAMPRSKHQQFMMELSNSGKSLAEIQTAWHDYYVALPDNEKYQVWQEFYEANKVPVPATAPEKSLPELPATPARTIGASVRPTSFTMPTALNTDTLTDAFSKCLPRPDRRSLDQIRHAVRNKVTAGGKLKVRHHLQSLAFGLGVGMVTIIILLFGFFNEVIIAPFIQPGRAAGPTPIIIGSTAEAASTGPSIIIPKINLDIPVDFSQTSTNEAVIENALESGIVHYPTTVMPGQSGNTAYFGHSSNNIFNPGRYKFAFVLLHELTAGDTFYITYSGKTYVYRVFATKIVDPSEVGVLDNVPGHGATATLITCDPPGTSLHRLVVIGDQISPDPSGNIGGTNTTASASVPAQLPDNGPSLWSRIWNSIF